MVGPHPKAQLGKDTSLHLHVADSTQFLVGYWTEGLNFLLAASQRPPSALATSVSPTWLLASSEPTRERQGRHHNLPESDHIMTSQHLCCIGLVKLVTGSSHARRGNYTRTGIASDGLLGATWASMRHTTSGRWVAANKHAHQAGGWSKHARCSFSQDT